MEDNQMVLDANMIGMKKTVWDPNFTLMVVGSLLRMVRPDTHMVYLYV